MKITRVKTEVAPIQSFSHENMQSNPAPVHYTQPSQNRKQKMATIGGNMGRSK